MARAKESTEAIQDLARELFIRRIVNRGPVTAWKIAADSFVDAADFLRVAEYVASGTAVDKLMAELVASTEKPESRTLAANTPSEVE